MPEEEREESPPTPSNSGAETVSPALEPGGHWGTEGPQGKPEAQAREEEIVQLRQQLDSKEQENKGLQDKVLRLYAEFENYKKRVSRDQEEFGKYANERLLKELLSVVDNLERAILHTQDAREPANILEGLKLILKQCLEVMGKFGVSAFESHLQSFDPSRHQAMGQMESDEHEEGTVIEEIQRGYRLNNRILRPALVIVSKKKDTEKIGIPEDTAGQNK